MRKLKKSIQKIHDRNRSIENIEKSSPLRVTVELIEKTIIKKYSLIRGELSSKTRKRRIVEPRQKAQFIMYVLLRHKGMVLQKIADRYKQTHDTVLHACSTVSNMYVTEEHYRDELNEIGNSLGMNMHDLVFDFIQYKNRRK